MPPVRSNFKSFTNLSRTLPPFLHSFYPEVSDIWYRSEKFRSPLPHGPPNCSKTGIDRNRRISTIPRDSAARRGPHLSAIPAVEKGWTHAALLPRGSGASALRPGRLPIVCAVRPRLYERGLHLRSDVCRTDIWFGTGRRLPLRTSLWPKPGSHRTYSLGRTI